MIPSVIIVPYKPSISIDNKVYLRKDGSMQCGTEAAVDLVQDYPNAAVTYCFAVTTEETPI